jgi:hypothetical protein
MTSILWAVDALLTQPWARKRFVERLLRRLGFSRSRAKRLVSKLCPPRGPDKSRKGPFLNTARGKQKNASPIQSFKLKQFMKAQ